MYVRFELIVDGDLEVMRREAQQTVDALARKGVTIELAELRSRIRQMPDVERVESRVKK